MLSAFPSWGASHHCNLSDAALLGLAALHSGKIDIDVGVLRRNLGLRPYQEIHLDCSWAKAIRSDFEHGDTISVKGWILSRTEAQLCAIVALLTIGE